MNHSKKIQKIIATLVTNPHMAENYIDFRQEFVSSLGLSKFDTDVLEDFYKENKENFTASVRILKKNRWEDIKLSLPIITKHIEPTKMNKIWEDYIRKNNILDLIPKNPLAESIIFADFAENHHLTTHIEQQLIEYEKTRNEVTYNHHENFTLSMVNKSVLIDENNIDKVSVFIHECYKIREFEYDIHKIINNESATSNCKILFFKNLNKEGIGTLKISNDIENILKNIMSRINLLEAYNFYKYKLTKNEFVSFLKNLKEIGVLTFVENKEDI